MTAETSRPELVIAGAGLRPGCLTQETLDGLKACAQVYLLNLPRELAARLKEELPRAAALDHAGGSWDAWERETVHRLVSAARERSVAALIAGHPLVFSIGPRLGALCARLRIPYRVLPGLSACNEVLALVEPYLCGRARWAFCAPTLVCSAEEIVRGRVRPQPGFSMLVFNLVAAGRGKGPEGATPLSAALSKAYGPDWPCYFVDAGVLRERPVEPSCLGRLAEHWQQPDGPSTLFVPLKVPREA